jgi:Tol biopolymer transport system component
MIMKKFLVCVFVAILFGVLLMVGLFSKPVVHSDLSKTKIAYVMYEEGSSFIYVMNSDGSNKTKLTAGSMPCWSPCRTKIAFTSEKNDNRDIWTKIAFTSEKNDNRDIYYMDADGSNIFRLTTHPDRDVNPAWSPDGSMIAFNSSRSGNSQIWRTNVTDGDGKETWDYNLTQLTQDTPHKRVNNYHSWSPNGLWLAFEADRDRDDPEIYLANAVDGTNQQRLTFTRALDEVPEWSFDSKQIIFSSDMHSEPKSGNYDIYIMDIDGSNLKRLTNIEGQASNPSMSPDGTKRMEQTQKAWERDQTLPGLLF